MLIAFNKLAKLVTGAFFLLQSYRPPPAHAQAHPAQAHAQAQEKPPPPPPLYPPFDELVDVFGGGLVIDVILDVKSLMFPTTFPEKFCTPVAMDAAKSAPGMRAELPPVEIVDPLGCEDTLPKLGS